MNLPDRDQVWHGVEVVRSEFPITSRFNPLPSFVNLSSQFVLNIGILGQLPEN